MQGNQTNLTRLTLMKVFKHGTSMFITALTVLGLIVIVNYVLAVKTFHIDVTANKINTLSEGTRTLLEDIDFPVSIKAFYITRSQTRISLLLKEYQHLNDNITFEIIDPLKNPVIAGEYDITEPSTIIFEAQGRRLRLKPPQPGISTSELEVTMMLYRFLTDESLTVYFLRGHGELSIDNPNQDGLSTAANLLGQQGYTVETLNLAATDSIPVAGSVVVIAEPKTALLDDEIEKLSTYLTTGGSVLVMGAPGFDTNSSLILNWHGLAFGSNFVYETSSDKTTEYGPTAPLCQPYEPSEIAEGLENQNILFPMTRSVDLVEARGNAEYIRLMASSADSWAETDINSAIEMRAGSPSRPTRDANEQRGPIVVACAVTTHLTIPHPTIVGSFATADVRSAFFGNARFATNSFVAQFPANLKLFQNTLNWITKNERAIEITPHAMMYTPVELRRSQQNLIFWITTIIYPALVVLLGIVVWVRKR